MVAGPAVCICERCTEICVEIFEEAGYKFSFHAVTSVVDLKKLGLHPRFKKLRFEQKHNHIFYLGPFSDPFNTIYVDHISGAAQAAGFSISRADEIFGTEPIIDDIWEGINRSTLIIADVSGRNPNVMYEIGMAHTVGKPVIIITQDINDVPFDLKHYRCIIYDYTPRGTKQLEEKLTNTLLFVTTQVKGAKPTRQASQHPRPRSSS